MPLAIQGCVVKTGQRIELNWVRMTGPVFVIDDCFSLSRKHQTEETL
jgi:hypothetical protein